MLICTGEDTDVSDYATIIVAQAHLRSCRTPPLFPTAFSATRRTNWASFGFCHMVRILLEDHQETHVEDVLGLLGPVTTTHNLFESLNISFVHLNWKSKKTVLVVVFHGPPGLYTQSFYLTQCSVLIK